MVAFSRRLLSLLRRCTCRTQFSLISIDRPRTSNQIDHFQTSSRFRNCLVIFHLNLSVTTACVRLGVKHQLENIDTDTEIPWLRPKRLLKNWLTTEERKRIDEGKSCSRSIVSLRTPWQNELYHWFGRTTSGNDFTTVYCIANELAAMVSWGILMGGFSTRMMSG